MKVTVVGTGYVGLTQGVCLAHLGHDVICVDIDAEKVQRLNSGEVPIFEEGLEELLREGLESGRLKFMSSFTEATVAHTPSVVFMCVQTPQADDGTCNLTYLASALHDVSAEIDKETLVVIKSTVPPGTKDYLKNQLGNSELEIVINPEFLAQGSAIKNFLKPDRIILGVESDSAAETLKELYNKIEAPVFVMSVESAQLTKYAANSMLALRLSFMNEMANIADVFGADIKDIEAAVGADPRIGSKFLRAGAGFGGSCFPKDVLALYHAAGAKGYQSKLIAPIIEVNRLQPIRFVDKIENRIGKIAGQRLGVWGLTYNKGTDDVRHSPAIVIIKELLSRGADIHAHDPQGLDNAKALLGNSIGYAPSMMEAVRGSEVLLTLTEWPEFKEADWQGVLGALNHKIIFDGKNFLPHDDLHQLGFEVYGMGICRKKGGRLQ